MPYHRHFLNAMRTLPILVLAACAATDSDNVASSVPPAPNETATEQAENQDAAIMAFFEEVHKADLENSPFFKSYLGIRDADYSKWDDPSDAKAIADYERGQKALADMRATFEPAALNASNALSYRLFEYQAERGQRAFPFRNNGYIFDQMNGAQSRLPAFLINIHRVNTVEDAFAYVSRISEMGPLLDALTAQSRERAENGVMPPKWVYPYVISDIENLIDGADGNAILADFDAKIQKLEVDDTIRAGLFGGAKDAWWDTAVPAYQRLLAEMKRQQAIAPTDDGVWRFKDGADYYAERLQNYTTTNLTADEIHQIGLDNVARIHGEMRKIMDEVGFEGSLQDFFKYVRTSDEFYFDTREAYLAEANAKISAMEAKLPEYFNTLPKAPLVVKPVEAFREKSAGKAFYQSPAPDGSRPGTYYVNLYNLKDMSKNELEALAYHEALPGHHLQRAIQTELGELPPFRRFGGVTAYIEGWGLYSEELGKDMGFYTDPYSDFGRLGMELWRACRLVVDTGIHHKRWSREEAIQYLTDNTPNPDGDIRKAIERYIVYPGQATAYMIGKLKIMELRDRARTRLGPRFTYGDFHDVILRAGPVPLTILEERVDNWLRKELMIAGD